MKTARRPQMALPDLRDAALLLATEQALETELLALVPEDSRSAAEATLLLLMELHAAGAELVDGNAP